MSDFAVTGGVAVAAHLAHTMTAPRPLNDLDIVITDASAIPGGLASNLLVSHVHLDAKPGRMLLQLVEPESKLRIDLFGAFGGQLRRSRPVRSLYGCVRIVSPADFVSRFTTLLLDLGLDEAVPAKHARDHAALLARAAIDDIEDAWADHRRTRHSEHFEQACQRIRALMQDKAHLLVTSAFLPASPCTRCRDTAAFRLAEDRSIVKVLGYR